MNYKKFDYSITYATGLFLIFDFIWHSTIGNPETLYYFIFKFIIAGYFVFLYYSDTKITKKIDEIFKLKKDTFYRLSVWATLFAATHGLYYRILELIQGRPLFWRVGDIIVGPLIFDSTNILMGALGWWLLHGGGFVISVMLVNYLKKR